MEFWEIYDGHYARVHSYATSMLRDRSAAEDVVQETFLRVQRSLAEVREPDKVSPWVFRIAHNLCVDLLRARKSSPIDHRAEPDEQCSFGEAASPENDVERGRMGACVLEKIAQLKESHRSILLLCDIMELPQQEVAEILGLEIGAVKVRLHRARTKLREVLRTECAFTRDERDVFVCEPVKPGRP